MDPRLELLARVEAGGSDDDAHQLLNAFFRGFRLDNLIRLLASDNAAAVEVGAWIASELGAEAAPVLAQIVPVLEHSAKAARFFAIDAVLVCAGASDAVALAKTIALLRDSDAGVRWKAMQFLARASSGQLGTSEQAQTDEELRSLTAWLRGTLALPEPAIEIREKLSAGSSTARMFGVAAAARSGLTARLLLTEALASPDQEIRDFAGDQLKLLH